jgi:hypothetical protein
VSGFEELLEMTLLFGLYDDLISFLETLFECMILNSSIECFYSLKEKFNLKEHPKRYKILKHAFQIKDYGFLHEIASLGMDKKFYIDLLMKFEEELFHAILRIS